MSGASLIWLDWVNQKRSVTMQKITLLLLNSVLTTMQGYVQKKRSLIVAPKALVALTIMTWCGQAHSRKETSRKDNGFHVEPQEDVVPLEGNLLTNPMRMKSTLSVVVRILHNQTGLKGMGVMFSRNRMFGAHVRAR